MMEKAAVTVFAFVIFALMPSGALAVPSGKVLTWEGGGQGTVKFEGREHAEKGYKCDTCHPSIFQMKKGAAKMTMELLNQGKFCGACHNGKTAFGTNDPKKCHECHKMKKKHEEHERHKGHDRGHDD